MAGVQGHVYRLQWTDKQGKQHREEAVLTSDPLVVEMTDAYLSGIQSLYGSGATAFRNSLPEGERGLLRSGGFRVESISGKALPASDFELPAKPMDPKQFLPNR